MTTGMVPYLTAVILMLSNVFVTIYSQSLNVTYSPASLDKFRIGETRLLTVRVVDSSSGSIGRENRSVTVECLDKEVCRVVSYPGVVSFIEEDNYTVTFEVYVNALFLGVTKLNIAIDNEVLPPYELRLLRSNREAKVTFFFNIFLGIFILIISTMMGTQLETRADEFRTSQAMRPCRHQANQHMRRPELVRSCLQKYHFESNRVPVGPMIGFCCQFGLMPLLGFLLAEFGLPADATSLKMALFAVSTCPGGGKSSFWTIIFGGNLDLSISMTFSQTLAALFMMPLWMSTVGKHFTDAHVRIPFVRIIQGLIAIMIPTSIGMIGTYYRPEYIGVIRKWIKRVSWAAAIVLSIFAIYSNYYIFWLLSWPIVLCGCALPWLGYITAFLVATLFRQNFKDTLTIAIETGIQNVGIAMILMIWCLPEPESDIAITIIFVTAIMTDKPLLIIWLSSRMYTRCCKRDKVKQVDDMGTKSCNASTATVTTQLSDALAIDPIKEVKEEIKAV